MTVRRESGCLLVFVLEQKRDVAQHGPRSPGLEIANEHVLAAVNEGLASQHVCWCHVFHSFRDAVCVGMPLSVVLRLGFAAFDTRFSRRRWRREGHSLLLFTEEDETLYSSATDNAYRRGLDCVVGLWSHQLLQ